VNAGGLNTLFNYIYNLFQPLPNATLQRRLAAMIYDRLLLFTLLMICAIPVVFIAGENSSFFKSPLYTLYLYSISFVFFGWLWTQGGQTLGIRLGYYSLATTSLTLFCIGFI